MRARRSIGAVLAGLTLALGVWACGGSGETPSAPTTSAPAPTTRPRAPGGGERGKPPTGDGRGGVKLTELGSFEQPLYVTQPAGGDPDHVYVVEQCGRVLRVPIAGGEPRTFLDLGDQVTCGGEQGLLSIAFAPDYADSGLLYADYTDTGGDSRVVELRAAPGGATADPSSARELLHIDDFAPNHNGGLLLFGPDRRLYLGMGDGGGAGDPERTAQDPKRPLGKLLRIDPADPGSYEIAALGLRNPWRYSFDPVGRAIWIGDVGQDTFEEIDSAPASALGPTLNFGWSAFEGTMRFNDDQSAPGARRPVLEYGRDRGCSVTGGYVVRDPSLRSLYGRYLYGDFCAGELRSFSAGAADPAADDRALGPRVPQLSSFGEDAAGHVYATSLAGPVFRIESAG